MVKYLRAESTSSELIKFNTETQNAETVRSYGTGIDWLWVADEDGEFDGNPVSKGDVIFSMYVPQNGYARKIIIVKDEGLSAFYKEITEWRKKEEEARKKECMGESPCCGTWNGCCANS